MNTIQKQARTSAFKEVNRNCAATITTSTGYSIVAKVNAAFEAGLAFFGRNRYALALLALFGVTFGASAQTNTYGIPDGGGLTSTLSTPFNAAAGWWLAAVAFILVSGWVLMMLRRKR